MYLFAKKAFNLEHPVLVKINSKFQSTTRISDLNPTMGFELALQECKWGTKGDKIVLPEHFRSLCQTACSTDITFKAKKKRTIE